MSLGKKSQIVAPLIKIVAFSVKKIWGSFWLFLAQNVALPNSKHLDTLFKVLKDVAKTSSYTYHQIIFFGEKI